MVKKENLEKATFAGGCFWCTEAVFQRVRGVEDVVPVYTGGHARNPSYEEVSSGETGHAEAVEVLFDPTVVSYQDLLSVFFATHDPTTLNRQGNDVGSQYRSAVYYHNEEQKKSVEVFVEKLSEKYNDPIVTEILPAGEFYPAEREHVDYYMRNKGKNPYCRVVIDPKIKKLFSSYGRLAREVG